jgi:hypothetical protein
MYVTFTPSKLDGLRKIQIQMKSSSHLHQAGVRRKGGARRHLKRVTQQRALPLGRAPRALRLPPRCPSARAAAASRCNGRARQSGGKDGRAGSGLKACGVAWRRAGVVSGWLVRWGRPHGTDRLLPRSKAKDTDACQLQRRSSLTTKAGGMYDTLPGPIRHTRQRQLTKQASPRVLLSAAHPQPEAGRRPRRGPWGPARRRPPPPE